jgi:hypothetical protein
LGIVGLSREDNAAWDAAYLAWIENLTPDTVPAEVRQAAASFDEVALGKALHNAFLADHLALTLLEEAAEILGEKIGSLQVSLPEIPPVGRFVEKLGLAADEVPEILLY